MLILRGILELMILMVHCYLQSFNFHEKDIFIYHVVFNEKYYRAQPYYIRNRMNKARNSSGDYKSSITMPEVEPKRKIISRRLQNNATNIKERMSNSSSKYAKHIEKNIYDLVPKNKSRRNMESKNLKRNDQVNQTQIPKLKSEDIFSNRKLSYVKTSRHNMKGGKIDDKENDVIKNFKIFIKANGSQNTPDSRYA
jgi:hypothetical protein